MIVAGLGAGLVATTAAVIGWNRGEGGLLKASSPLPKPTDRSSAVAESVPATPVAADVMTRGWFEPYLGTEFQVKVSALTATTVKLIEVSAAKTITDKAKGIEYTSFSLTFSGPKSLPEESKVYRLEHGVLGAMDLFLTSVGKHEREVRLEAVFSQRA